MPGAEKLNDLDNPAVGITGRSKWFKRRSARLGYVAGHGSTQRQMTPLTTLPNKYSQVDSGEPDW